jgi:hypothetical protein
MISAIPFGSIFSQPVLPFAIIFNTSREKLLNYADQNHQYLQLFR